ncbi:MAG: hypothetical protein AB9869_33180 [Verrucomicrobiia bacterium]
MNKAAAAHGGMPTSTNAKLTTFKCPQCGEISSRPVQQRSEPVCLRCHPGMDKELNLLIVDTPDGILLVGEEAAEQGFPNGHVGGLVTFGLKGTQCYTGIRFAPGLSEAGKRGVTAFCRAVSVGISEQIYGQNDEEMERIMEGLSCKSVEQSMVSIRHAARAVLADLGWAFDQPVQTK